MNKSGGKNRNISKVRLKKVGTRERKTNVASEVVPFRNSDFLAILYVLLTMLFTTGIMAWVYPIAGFKHWYKHLPLAVLILLLSVVCMRVMLGIVDKKILRRNSRILMLCVVAAFSVSISAASLSITSLPEIKILFPIDISETSHFLLPYIFAPAMATLLAGTGAGLSFGLGMAFLNLLFIKNDFAILPVIAAGITIAIVTPRLLQKVRRRVALLRAFSIVGCVQFLAVIIFLSVKLASANGADTGYYTTLGMIVAFAAIATILSTGISYAATILLLAFLEHIFAATSNIRLNEFTDLSNPILQRLSLEAPGTYHHSVVVASLAAAAAERIGANALLARVGAYYHDIGKLTKPSFYTENTGGSRHNPHDNITANMSSVIIGAHVKEGIGIAIHHNLPPPILDIIKEHHGTSVMSWFLHKAKEEAKLKAAAEQTQPEPIDENQFRYPGPRPATKESGIVMLADCVEAASRSLERPTPSAIENLVENIVTDKVSDEQLDLCPLTFIDLVSIKRTFITTISNILHARVPYPKDSEQKDKNDETENNDKKSSAENR